MQLKQKILLNSVLTSFAFWIPIWLPLALIKNIQISTAYQIIGIYSLAVVLLEYPTGVIGDAYSHKLSTVLGYLATGISSLVMVFAPGVTSLTVGVLIFALGTSLISGSDQAYFHSILKDEYKKFYPTMKNTGLIATLIGISLGTLLFKVSYLLPLVLNAVAFFISTFVLLGLPKEDHINRTASSSNPFAVAKMGFKTFFTSPTLQSLLIVYAVIFAFSNNLKWLYGNILGFMNLPVQYWGILIAFFYLGRFIGIQFQHKVKGKKSTVALLVALANLIFILGFIYDAILIPIVIFIIMVIIGAIETDLEIDIQENTPNNVRSSVLSLKSLLGRLSAAMYIFLVGTLTTSSSITKLTMATFALILFATGVQISAYLRRSETKPTTE